MKKLKLFILLLIVFALCNISCSVYQTIVNISRLKFKLANVSDYTVCGVNIANKKSINDLSPMEAIKLTASFVNKSMPSSFILNISAVNPNDGKGGYPSTNATIVAFPWRLVIDGKETITGDLAQPVAVPGTGQETVIPIRITIDLYKLFSNKEYEGIINLAMNLSGNSNGNASKIVIYAKPKVATPLGNISYPQEVKIVSLEYSK